MKNDKTSITIRSNSTGCLNVICGILIAMIGYTIHGSIFWSVADFFFWPIAFIKWMICQELTLTIIKNTFPTFFQ